MRNSCSIIITIEGFVPIASPLIGGFINDLWGWRSIFGLFFIYALITIVYVFFAFPETLKVKNGQLFPGTKPAIYINISPANLNSIYPVCRSVHLFH
ncbi:hypothetical protein [Candidatus Arsenophonus triatominarum]|uniref:hypothetical protein n=1 Tax=Candidatus Arsenophonus triatominarum TaxID=57911 RepID=UPI0007C4DED2|nr:hypothetical protein [Candidatus Arsenophonus triatominarum]